MWINDLLERFSQQVSAKRLSEHTGMDYSDTEMNYDYVYDDNLEDDIDIGDFDSQHRLVGGRVEK